VAGPAAGDAGAERCARAAPRARRDDAVVGAVQRQRRHAPHPDARRPRTGPGATRFRPLRILRPARAGGATATGPRRSARPQRSCAHGSRTAAARTACAAHVGIGAAEGTAGLLTAPLGRSTARDLSPSKRAPPGRWPMSQPITPAGAAGHSHHSREEAFMIRNIHWAAALLSIGAATSAHASCGSAFCTLLNDRFALGTWDHVGWSIDMRLESVTQDKLKTGSHTIDASQVTGEEALERHTDNTNLVATLERAFDMHWSLALRVPVVKRDHLHDLIDDTTGAIGPSEQWKFTKLGDVSLLARWQDAQHAPDSSWAATAGL